MLPPLLILFGLLLTQKEPQANFFSDEVMQKLRVTSNTLTLKARNALFFLVALLSVIALAGPVIDQGEIEVKSKSSDILIALDISDSMLAQDLYPNRLKLAKQKALEFLKLESSERVGVIAFAKDSYLVSPLSFDHDAVAFLLRELDTDFITQKGTDFLSMLKVVKNSSKNSKKYVVIFTDGGDKKDFSKEIEYAKSNNIVVFILAVATKKGSAIKQKNGEFIKQNGHIIISKLNENIALLATKTGGVYIKSVNSNKDILMMIKKIKEIANKKELKSEKIKKYFPLFYYPLGLALFILLLATSSMSKRKEVEVPGAFLIALLIGLAQPTQASIFDFKKLEEAKDAYENGNYNYASKLYENYALKNNSSEAFYNSANALYKAKKYNQAINMYKKAKFKTKQMEAMRFANIANSYAKIGTKESLKKAISNYETSLKLKEDKDVRENLEAVKRALENKDKQNKKDKNKQNKKEKNKQNKDKNQQNNKKDNKQNSNKQQDKNSNSNKDNKKSDKKDSNKQDKQNKKDNKEKDKNRSNEKSKDKQNRDKKESKNINANKEQEKLKEQTTKMSDLEVKKWLKKLNSKSHTYIYKLNRSNKEHNYEKPW